MNHIQKYCLISLLPILLAGCPTSSPDSIREKEEVLIGEVRITTDIPDTVPQELRNFFTYYSPIFVNEEIVLEILAADKLTKGQILHVNRLARFYLESQGEGDSPYAKNTLGKNLQKSGSFLGLFNTLDDREDASFMKDPQIHIQDLAGEEIILAGSPQYMDFQNFRRDASFEEIIHIIDNNGFDKDPILSTTIVPDTQNAMKADDITLPMTNQSTGNLIDLETQDVGVLEEDDLYDPHGINATLEDPYIYHPNYRDYFAYLTLPLSEIQDYAAEFGMSLDDMLEFAKKDAILTLRNEYFAYGIDAWYAIGDHPSSSPEFSLQNRDALETGDEKLHEIIDRFIPRYLDFVVPISDEYLDDGGTFFMEYNATLEYTKRSQYIKDAQLLGEKSINLQGNSQDNSLQGNKGDNTLNGGDGSDEAVFAGLKGDYTITKNGEEYILKDNKDNRDGTDTLVKIERVRFADVTLNVDGLN